MGMMFMTFVSFFLPSRLVAIDNTRISIDVFAHLKL
jgi:hypothetical protein